MAAAGRVLVITKAPVPGRAKTRLVPPLAADQAAELAAAMLLDTLDGCRAGGRDVGLLCPSAEDATALSAVVGADVPILVQTGVGLRDALRGTMRGGLGDGPLAIVSSDIPGVPDGQVEAAFASLATADVVLGPALDGGYWLIAMSTFHEAPFQGIPWSTPACLAVTERRIADAGLTSGRLRPWLDIDTSVDLSIAVHDPPGPVAARTAGVLRRIADGLEVPEPPPHRLDKSALVAASPWRSFIHDRLAGPDGAGGDYAYLAVPRAVFVVAVTRDRHVLLVRQYRHPVRDWTLEIPAGTVEDGETARQAAERELREEVGAVGGDWRHLGRFFSSSAHLSLRSDVFLATGVRVGRADPDPGEDLAVVRLPLGEVLAAARSGALAEGQTALALLLAARHLE